MTITDDIKLKEFNSDEEAIQNGLREGDFYLIREFTEPYYLPRVIKRVCYDTERIQQEPNVSESNQSVC